MKRLLTHITRTLRALRLKQIDINLLLAVVIIVLVNVVGQGAYLRSDLTAQNVYSLSPVSTELMGRLDRPMKAKVFFTADVPAKYTTVRRYVKDIVKQYDSTAGSNFSYEVYSMDKPEHQQQASDYGVTPVQIREVRGNELQQTRAYMSVVLLYGDRIEKIDGITTTQGVEYDVTTTMLDMVNSVNAYAGLEEPINVTAYVSQNLSELQISGMGKLIPNLRDMLKQVNEQTGGHLEAEVRRPEGQSRIEEIEQQYGLQTIEWESDSNGASDESSQNGQASATATKKGLMGLVLQYRDRTKTVPIHITGSIFGYELEKIGEVRKTLEERLSSLVQSNPPIAYVTGHGEKSLEPSRRTQQQPEAGTFKRLMNELYQLRTVDLRNNSIPENVNTVVVNGPKNKFTERELYKLDQFLMRGGSLMVFADPFQRMGGGRSRRARAQYRPLDTGLGELLSSYGISLKQNYVLDTRSYVQRQQNRSDIKMKNAPMVEGDSLNDSHLITEDLARVLYLNSSSIGVPGKKGENQGNVAYTALARSSENSWLMEEDITLNPMMIREPGPDVDRKAHNLTVLAEGNFRSHFDEPVRPSGEKTEAEQQESTGQGSDGSEQAGEEIRQTIPHLEESAENGRLLVAGTSALTGSQLLGNQPQRGSNPNRILIQNMADYMNGNTDIPPMRTKGLQMHRLGETTAVERQLIKGIHIVAIPLIVIGIGIGVWLRRKSYQRSIRRMMEKEAEV